MRYEFTAIEARWQLEWSRRGTFKTPNPGEAHFDPAKPKFYVLDMFPYPSGVGLHVGHPLGYIATDIVARYKRMTGHNVLHPMGYDAFGLPAEQFAVEHGVHPAVTTQKNIDNMTRQLKRLGLSYDWDRAFATTDPDYYKWTQWIFLQLYNSYFDPVEKKAKPIAELVHALQEEDYFVGLDGELVWAGIDEDMSALGGVPDGVRKWEELSAQQQAALLNESRLAYLAEVPVNWCPALGTVLANEEVTNEGRSERGNHPVFKRPLEQWMLRITSYADRLQNDLEQVAWPEAIKIMQRNWIGRSEGARVDFPIDADRTPGFAPALLGDTGEDGDSATSPRDVITVFTTRPDTLFGATYMVLAPEHPLVDAITTTDQRDAVEHYRAQAAARSDVERVAAPGSGATKTGVFTGAYAVNPATQESIPIWIADYVLWGYGTGAIMAVPAHDDRDFAFAQTFGLPIVPVVMPTDDWLQEQAQESDRPQSTDGDELRRRYLDNPAALDEAFTGHGVGVNSENSAVSLNGLPTAEAKQVMTQWLEDSVNGKAQVQYKLRDWLFSRQRYWGEPFPILHGPDGRIVPVDESELPVALPEMEDFKPITSGAEDPDAEVQTPLSRAPDSWKYVERNGQTCTRELNTMPQWAGSCWYYLRFLDPRNGRRFVGKDAEKYWMLSPKKSGGAHAGGVDLYVGGAEHAVLHLLYARFWHKVLYDLGHVSTPEPFGRLFNQGYIQAFAYRDERGIAVEATEVVDPHGTPAAELEDKKDVTLQHNGRPVRRELGKMGKSLKNAVTPDDICDQYGCDTMRLYEMYLGPLDQSKLWRTQDIVGVHRFLQRLWRNFVDADSGALLVNDEPPSDGVRRKLHKTIKRVTDGMNNMSFNTAIAALIELNNDLVQLPGLPREVAEPMVLCLSPLAPHIAEELWNLLGHTQSLAYEPWPTYDPAMLVEDQIEYPVQVNGKLRGKVTVPADADDEAVRAAALADERVQAAINGKTVRKVIVIKGRLVNVVVG